MKGIKWILLMGLALAISRRGNSQSERFYEDSYRAAKKGYAFSPRSEKQRHQSYLAISASLGTGIMNTAEQPALYKGDVGIYLKPEKVFYLQPELRFGVMSYKREQTLQQLYLLQFPLSAVLDFRIMNIKAGINLEVYRTRGEMVAGHGIQVGFGSRIKRFDFDFRAAVNGINTRDCYNQFALQVGYLFNR